MHTNGATSSKIIKKKTNKKFLKGAQIAEQGKVAKYEAHYENELVKNVIMLIIEAGGALGKGFTDEVNSWFAIPGINKIKLGNLVNWMFRRISFHQANFNEKMYIEAFKSIKRYEIQHPTEFPPALLVPNIDEAIYPRFSQVVAIDENEDEDEVPVEIPVEVPVEVPAEVPVEVPVHQTFQMIEDQDQEQEDDPFQQQRTNHFINMLRGPIPAISDPSSLSTHPLVQSSSSNNHRAATAVPDLHSPHQHQNGQSSSSSSSSSSSIIVHVPPVELDQSNYPSYSAVHEAEVESIITNGLADNQAH
jgi:hypothetical protein